MQYYLLLFVHKSLKCPRTTCCCLNYTKDCLLFYAEGPTDLCDIPGINAKKGKRKNLKSRKRRKGSMHLQNKSTEKRIKYIQKSKKGYSLKEFED